MDIDARVLICDKDHILLVLEKEKLVTPTNGEVFIKPSKWGMPGGRGESGDKDALDTAWRETKEETNLSIFINEDSIIKKEMASFTRFAFIGDLDPDSKVIKINPEEILECKWFPRGVLYDENFNMYSAHRQMAQELLRKLGQ